MRLPKQAKPVMRNVEYSRQTTEKGSVSPSCVWCGDKTCYGVCSAFGCIGYCG